MPARKRHVMALVLLDADRLWLAVTGDASVVVETAAGDRRFDGIDSWATDTVEQAHAVSLISRACEGGGAAGYMVDGGVVPAALVSRRLTAAVVVEDDPLELPWVPSPGDPEQIKATARTIRGEG